MPTLRYLGHCCFTLSDGTHRLIFDPWLSAYPDAAASPDEVEVDFVLPSHGHSDHLGDSISIAKRCGATIVAPYELAMYCKRHGAEVHPLHIGGGHAFPFGYVKLTQATHGSAVVTDELIEYTGPAAGFLVTMGDSVVYFAGDTGLFGDMRLIGDRNALDMAMLPIGDNFTMGVDDAAEATRLLHPKTVVPMHYDANDYIRKDPQLFVEKVKGLADCVVMRPGERLEI